MDRDSYLVLHAPEPGKEDSIRSRPRACNRKKAIRLTFPAGIGVDALPGPLHMTGNTRHGWVIDNPARQY